MSKKCNASGIKEAKISTNLVFSNTIELKSLQPIINYLKLKPLIILSKSHHIMTTTATTTAISITMAIMAMARPAAAPPERPLDVEPAGVASIIIVFCTFIFEKP